MYPLEVVQHLYNFLQCIFGLPLIEQAETGGIFVLIDHLDVIVAREFFEDFSYRHVVVEFGLWCRNRVRLSEPEDWKMKVERF